MSFLRIDTNIETRQFGFRDACSRLVELDETVSLPGGFKLVNSEKKENKKSNVADFDGSLSSSKGKVVLHEKLALKKRVYQAGDWNDFRDAVNAYKDYGNYLIIKR
jgi:hypothetical protein